LLLDTHVLLWWLTKDVQLRKAARTAITDAAVVYVSAASAWEMAIKAATGKLRVPGDLERQISSHQFLELPVTIAHGVAAARLLRHHGDPFDRMLVAQASLESLVLLTNDEKLAAYGVPVMIA
jgi:PIN domain nuclease of toxin-antitoxin system